MGIVSFYGLPRSAQMGFPGFRFFECRMSMGFRVSGMVCRFPEWGLALSARFFGFMDLIWGFRSLPPWSLLMVRLVSLALLRFTLATPALPGWIIGFWGLLVWLIY